MWIKNTGGKKDAALTLMVVAFVFSLFLALVGSVENITLGDRNFNFRAFDMGFATTVLVPLIALPTSGDDIRTFKRDCTEIRLCGQ